MKLLRRSGRLGAALATALVLLTPFAPRTLAAGAVAALGNAAGEHEHRVSVRTSGACADLVIEHAAETPHDTVREEGARHEHREICLARPADALTSNLVSGGSGSGAAWRLPLGAAPLPPLCPSFAAADLFAPAARGARALRNVVLQI